MNQTRMTRLFRFYAGAYARIANALENANGHEELARALNRASHWQARLRKVHTLYV